MLIDVQLAIGGSPDDPGRAVLPIVLTFTIHAESPVGELFAEASLCGPDGEDPNRPVVMPAHCTGDHRQSLLWRIPDPQLHTTHSVELRPGSNADRRSVPMAASWIQWSQGPFVKAPEPDEVVAVLRLFRYTGSGVGLADAQLLSEGVSNTVRVPRDVAPVQQLP